jgi:hypothetical protein
MMRALGPGSVSSLLKVILDVIHFALWAAAIVASAGIVIALLLSIRPELSDARIVVGDIHIEGAWLGPLLAAVLLAVIVYFAGAIIIVGRLRRISETLVAGDPFHPSNVRRLQIIAGALAGLELGRYVVNPLLRLAAHDIHHFRMSGGVSLTTWFAVLVIVVLAEVFREGARLRGEAELTI